MILDAAETILGYFGFDRTVYLLSYLLVIVIFARLVLRLGLFHSYNACIPVVMFAGYVFVSSPVIVLLCKPNPYLQKVGLLAIF